MDATLSTEFLPVGRFKRIQKLNEGEVVQVDIAVMPWMQKWLTGQQVRLIVSGKPAPDVVKACICKLDTPSVSAGAQIIHAGGTHESYLQMPLIPTPQ